jgi:two-component sensor histidine kinase
VTTLVELAQTHTGVTGDQLAHLQRLVASWNVLADLSFADLLLLVPIEGEEGHRFMVLDQVRPMTGQTLYPQDMVETLVDEVERPLVTRAWRLGEIVEGDAPLLGASERVRLQCVPIRCGGKLIALLTREAPITSGRRPGELERVFLDVFDRFALMIAEGSFPFAREEVEPEDAPRVGDGAIVLDVGAHIRFASPNAVTSMHRMGIHAYTSGLRLADVGFEDSAVEMAARAHAPITEEIERGETSILLRVLPLFEGNRPLGALMLIRDVTDLRRRDRLLMSKDATIREIHHRVKNNLQTIAALLRLQGRRLESKEARQAIQESERRIRSIAIVHETLSREATDFVAFSDIIKPLVRVVEESVSTEEGSLRFKVEGDAGDLPGEVATPLAVILNELMQNSVDHAFPDQGTRLGGNVTIHLARVGDEVQVDVVDDGVGPPEGFDLDNPSGLGLQIVLALVRGELGGSIELLREEGTRVRIRVPAGWRRLSRRGVAW